MNENRKPEPLAFARMTREELPRAFWGFKYPPVIFARRHHSGAWLIVFESDWNRGFQICWIKRASVWSRPYKFGSNLIEANAFAEAESIFEEGPPRGFAIVRHKSMAPRDSQRQRVYNWERESLRWQRQGDLSLDQCEAIVREVWTRVYPGKLAPHLKDGRGRRAACYQRSTHSIKLPKWARFREVVLHEIAHSLSRARPYHGPEFVGVYLALLVEFAGYNPDSLLRSIRDKGVKWAPEPRVWNHLGVKWGRADTFTTNQGVES